MTLFAVNGAASKAVIAAGMPTYRLAELRCAGVGVGVLFLIAAAARDPRSLRPARSELPWLIAFGVVSLGALQFLYFVGISRLLIGVALVIQYLAPVWVAL